MLVLNICTLDKVGFRDISDIVLLFVLSPHKIYLRGTVLMKGHNICFLKKIKRGGEKTIPRLFQHLL